ARRELRSRSASPPPRGRVDQRHGGGGQGAFGFGAGAIALRSSAIQPRFVGRRTRGQRVGPVLVGARGATCVQRDRDRVRAVRRGSAASVRSREAVWWPPRRAERVSLAPR